AEYFLYDPLGEWLKPPLQGFRLVDGQFVQMEPAADGSLRSEQLGITLRLEDGQLALFDTATGNRLMTAGERAAQAEARLAEAEARVQALEEELRRRGGRT